MPLVLASAGGCRGEGSARSQAEPASERPAQQAPAKPAIDDEATYRRIRDRFERDPQATIGAEFEQVRTSLRAITNDSEDAHLRANAALFLGTLHEARKELAPAIDLYRHAAKLVADDAGPHMALALALAAHGQHAEAVTVQEKATALDPDNLENYLVLGEMRIKAGDAQGGAQAYVDYERHRKSLIDGLTLTKDGNYLVSIDERIGCADALASAADLGTAVALLYALEIEPEPRVRQAIVHTMGVQRLEGYKHRLAAHLEKEQDPDVREVVAWTLGEIERDPVVAQPPPGSEAVPAAEPETPAAEPDDATGA
jgi:tetratricopeptide (TPR) repeat protein